VVGGVPQANVAVPGQAVVVRLMPVPTGMPEEELADVVAQEAINHVPFPMREANLDWSIMGATERTDADGVRRVDVILAAIQKTIVDSYWRLAETAGVRLGRIDISSLAATRALSFAGYLQPNDKLTMSVIIRHDATDINLIKNGMPLFSRSVLLGVETLGEAISRSLDVHLDDALNLLPQIQLFGMSPATPELGQAAQIARTVFGDITDEVSRSFEFYRSQVGEVVVDQIILAGSGCRVPSLDQFISNRLNVSTVVANPLRQVTYDPDLVPEERRPGQTITLGAVLEPDAVPVPVVELDLNKEGPSAGVLEGMEERPTVRIIPQETPWFMPALAGGIALTVVSGALWGYFSQVDVPRKQSELEELQRQIEDGKKQLKDLDQLKSDNSVLAQKKRLLDGIVNERQPWSRVLDVVRQSAPPGVRVKKLVLNGNVLQVEGTAVDFTSVSYLAINMGGSTLLSDSTVDFASRDDKEPRMIDFGVSARIRPGAGALGPAAERVASRPQVLDFYADWCGPCKEMKPVLDEAKTKYGDRVDFVAVNADDPGNRPLMDKYKVTALPTLCFLDSKGQLIEQIVGFDGSAPIVAALEKVTQVATSGGTR